MILPEFDIVNSSMRIDTRKTLPIRWLQESVWYFYIKYTLPKRICSVKAMILTAESPVCVVVGVNNVGLLRNYQYERREKNKNMAQRGVPRCVERGLVCNRVVSWKEEALF